jgi:hypothetical protein
MFLSLYYYSFLIPGLTLITFSQEASTCHYLLVCNAFFFCTNNFFCINLVCCLQETPHHVYLVMEYCNGGDLADYLNGKNCFIFCLLI